MKRPRRRQHPVVLVAAGFFLAGAAAGWALRGGPPRTVAPGATAPPASAGPVAASPVPAATAPSDARATSDVPAAPPASPPLPAPASAEKEPAISPDRKPYASAVEELAHRGLRIPVDGAKVEAWKGMFAEGRDVNSRPHSAVDILAPRNTPVHAIEDGTIAKLFYSKAGGNTVYQFDPDQRFCYYYAHLERYAAALDTGRHVSRGDVIGYVGTSGNAPANTPHLHFAIFVLDADRRWWHGQPLDPYLVFRRASG